MNRIKEIESLIGCTTINNTNNTNNTNNIVTKKQLHGEQLVSATPHLGHSLSSGKSGVGRPAEAPMIYGKWKWLKADLFSNETNTGKLHKKIAISLQKNGEEDVIRLKAAFSSPFRCFKRGVRDYDTNKHYQMAVSRYHELREQTTKYVWISKFYQNKGTTTGLNKPKSAHELSGILYLKHNQWTLDLMLWDMIMEIPLTDDVSKYKGNVIASRSINCGQGVAEPSGMINTRELLG